MFVVFEGINASGKTKHVHLFIKNLRKAGKKVKLYSYPDKKGPYSNILSNFLSMEIELDPTTQFLTFLADITKDQERIRNDLDKGYWVIVDRYVLSTMAFQNIPLQRAKDLVSVMKPLKPDAICYLEVSPDIAMERIEGKRRYKRFERDKEHLLRAYLRYKELSEENTMGKWIVLDTTKPVEEVEEEIKRWILK